jgi:hypothetical protein
VEEAAVDVDKECAVAEAAVDADADVVHTIQSLGPSLSLHVGTNNMRWLECLKVNAVSSKKGVPNVILATPEVAK